MQESNQDAKKYPGKKFGIKCKIHIVDVHPVGTESMISTCPSFRREYTSFMLVTYVQPHIGIFIRQSVFRGRLKGRGRRRTRVGLMYAEPQDEDKRPVIASAAGGPATGPGIQYAGPIISDRTSEAEKQPYYPPLMKPRPLHLSALLLLTYKYLLYR